MATPVILVVGEEENLGRLLERVLKRDGFQVVLCASAGEAKARLEQGGVDLILADFELAEQNGAELLAEVQQRFPHLRRVLMCASPDAPAIQEALRNKIAEAMVLKPWNHADLSGAIKRLLPPD